MVAGNFLAAGTGFNLFPVANDLGILQAQVLSPSRTRSLLVAAVGLRIIIMGAAL